MPETHRNEQHTTNRTGCFCGKEPKKQRSKGSTAIINNLSPNITSCLQTPGRPSAPVIWPFGVKDYDSCKRSNECEF
ncbi:hypothetical protein ACQRIT_004330 [Beauveria bassiana]